MQQRLKLSRRETILAAAIGVVVLLAVAGQFYVRQQASAQEEQETQIRRLRAAVTRAQADADVTALEAQVKQLKNAVQNEPSLQADGGQVALRFWGWAEASGVTLAGFGYKGSAAKVEEIDVITHEYTLALQGDPKSLHQFVALTTTSPYVLQLRNLSLGRTPGSGVWDLEALVFVYAQQEPKA